MNIGWYDLAFLFSRDTETPL